MAICATGDYIICATIIGSGNAEHSLGDSGIPLPRCQQPQKKLELQDLVLCSLMRRLSVWPNRRMYEAAHETAHKDRVGPLRRVRSAPAQDHVSTVYSAYLQVVCTVPSAMLRDAGRGRLRLWR